MQETKLRAGASGAVEDVIGPGPHPRLKELAERVCGMGPSRELAGRSRLSHTTISKICKGVVGKAQTLHVWAEDFGVSVNVARAAVGLPPLAGEIATAVAEAAPADSGKKGGAAGPVAEREVTEARQAREAKTRQALAADSEALSCAAPADPGLLCVELDRATGSRAHVSTADGVEYDLYVRPPEAELLARLAAISDSARKRAGYPLKGSSLAEDLRGELGAGRDANADLLEEEEGLEEGLGEVRRPTPRKPRAKRPPRIGWYVKASILYHSGAMEGMREGERWERLNPEEAEAEARRWAREQAARKGVRAVTISLDGEDGLQRVPTVTEYGAPAGSPAAPPRAAAAGPPQAAVAVGDDMRPREPAGRGGQGPSAPDERDQRGQERERGEGERTPPGGRGVSNRVAGG